jgi:hypothetical protein
MFKLTLKAFGTGSGNEAADRVTIGKVIKAFNYLYSTNVSEGDFTTTFTGRSFVLSVKVPMPDSERLGEEMAAALEELLGRNGLR